ncbi:ABC transporter substrate-binding protein [Specibacter cremeus]|uniref:ABC transporter substrate-binding protein n=1 Tax=Specibacter cremeus TaxID=1629051 RepID=UPI000F79373C|nr:ABC transporter substrate-binding protein [Specibacter cremeus]
MKTTNRSTVPWQLAAAGIGVALMLAGCSGSGSAGGTIDPAAANVAVDKSAAALVPAKYKSVGVINVASDMPNPPMEMLDANQQPSGFDYDLSQQLSGKLGIKFNFQQQAFDASVASLQAGKNDVIMAGMNDTLERQKVLSFVDYFHAGFMILVPAGNPGNIKSVLDLCGQNVAVQKATVQGELLQSYAPKCVANGAKPINLVQLPAEVDAQTAVRSGKAVADVVDASVATYAAQTAGNGKVFSLVKDAANPSGYNPVYTGIGMLKGETGLSKAVAAALQSLIDDGSYAKLLKKYGLADFAVEKAGINRATS